MNRKQLTTLIVAGLLIGAAAILISKNKDKMQATSNERIGKQVVKNFPLNDVERITVKHGSEQMNLTRKDGRWVVAERADYPANFGSVSEFLRKVWDLKVVQPVPITEKQLTRLELTPQSGTVVEFKDKSGKVLNTLLLGKKHMRDNPNAGNDPFGGGGGGWPDGRYLMVGNDVKSAAVVSEPFANVEVKPADWVDKEFFKIEKHKSIAVSSPNVTNTWKLARESETNEWKLVDAKAGEQLDTAKAGSVTSVLAYPAFTDVATNSAPDQTGMDKPVVAKIDTLDGFSYDIKVGKKVADDRDDLYLQVTVNGAFNKERTPGTDEKPEDKARLDKEFKDKVDKLEEKLKTEKALGQYTYIVARYSIEPLFKDRKDLLVDKKEEPKPEEKKETRATPPKTPDTARVNPAKPPPLPPGAEKPEAK
ncbi:MAG TPA: DUF4340 domain-containing protein [Candidatus Binatia bacterium]|nr:DUF4340 domain-containing protein [Candidatus Binatia bacterium]